MTIVCSGSLAFDRLMTYPGVFSDHILADKLQIINVCFLVDNLKIVPGGTAGNIAYNLSMLEEKPLIVGCLGDDPDGLSYKARIEGWGLSTEAVAVHPGSSTAGCTIGTDNNNNQLLFFNPGAMNISSGFDPAALASPKSQHWALVSPGGATEMKSLCACYRDLGVPFILDPGQQIPAFTGDELLEMLGSSYALICNEYELEMFCQKTGKTADELFHYTNAQIITKGEKGSDLIVPHRGSQHVMAVTAGQVVDPTGAGDAFRAGLLKALSHNERLISACRFGSATASFCVEAQGPQGHSFMLLEVIARHSRTFNETITF